MPEPSAAQRLQAAWADRAPLTPFTETGEIGTLEEAYAVQQEWTAIRVAAGETVVGRKIGLTSPAMQSQMGVDEPDFGTLWRSRAYEEGEPLPHDQFIQPRAEGEIAFKIGRELRGPGIGPEDVLEAAEAAALAVEIVDSRIADWRIELIDTVADNASYGGFVVGEWSRRMLRDDIERIGLELRRNGDVVASETGAAVLGSPLRATAWLANKLGSLGTSIEPGHVVLSGSFGGAIESDPGDRFEISSAGEPTLAVEFEEAP